MSEVLLTKFRLFHMYSFLLVSLIVSNSAFLLHFQSYCFSLTVIYDLFPKLNGLGSIRTDCFMNFNE